MNERQAQLERIVRALSGDLEASRLSTYADMRLYSTSDGKKAGWWLLSTGGTRVELVALPGLGFVTAREMGARASAILSEESLAVALSWLEACCFSPDAFSVTEDWVEAWTA